MSLQEELTKIMNTDGIYILGFVQISPFKNISAKDYLINTIIKKIEENEKEVLLNKHYCLAVNKVKDYPRVACSLCKD